MSNLAAAQIPLALAALGTQQMPLARAGELNLTLGRQLDPLSRHLLCLLLRHRIPFLPQSKIK